MARIALKELDTDRLLAIEQLETLIGRDPACGLVIDGPKSKVVSGRHARIFFQDNTWWIQDMSRNGTILDDERLQGGQRHAVRVGQVIGLGESGPRLRVAVLDTRSASDTMLERPGFDAPLGSTAPRPRSMGAVATGGASVGAGTAPRRKPEAQRAGVKFEEPTEPARLSDAWHLDVQLRAAHSDQRFAARARVVNVGRSPDCSIRIPPEQGASVSRVHAEIAVGESGVIVRDAGSRNGTFLNGKRIQAAHPLVIGDKLMLGTGGPTLEVEELHIVKGGGPVTGDKPKFGGSTTSEAHHAADEQGGLHEPPTAPAATPFPHSHSHQSPPPPTSAGASAPRGAARQPQREAASPLNRARLAILVLLGALALGAAVLVGRMTAQ